MNADAVNQFFSFLYVGAIGEVVFWLRLFAGIVSSAIFAAIIVIAFKYRDIFKPRIRTPVRAAMAPVPSPALIAKPWREVQEKIASHYPSDWNVAVIRADAIFDNVLRDMGLLGMTLGDRLKQLDFAKLNSLNDVWEAHKIRNRIAHEATKVLTQEEAARAIQFFEKGLRELQYLEDE